MKWKKTIGKNRRDTHTGMPFTFIATTGRLSSVNTNTHIADIRKKITGNTIIKGSSKIIMTKYTTLRGVLLTSKEV